MTYYPDFSIYDYHSDFIRPGCVTIGWLEASMPFEKQNPSEEILEALWAHCSVLIAEMRGIHGCDLCDSSRPITAERNGIFRLIGTSEIRVFGRKDRIFAAPTLIYHYVAVHHYRPPDEFIEALLTGPKPQNDEFFRMLENIKLDWRLASSLDRPPEVMRFT